MHSLHFNLEFLNVESQFAPILLNPKAFQLTEIVFKIAAVVWVLWFCDYIIYIVIYMETNYERKEKKKFRNLFVG